MSSRAARLILAFAIFGLWAGMAARADAPAKPAPPGKPDAQAAPAPKSPAEQRAEIYERLAASSDADETQGLIGLLFGAYAQSGSDTGDLLLQRARKAMAGKDFDAARQILDSTVALLPDWA